MLDITMQKVYSIFLIIKTALFYLYLNLFGYVSKIKMQKKKLIDL